MNAGASARDPGPDRRETRASSALRAVEAPATRHPTALRIILGTHLRRLREAAKVTPEVAGEAIRGSQAKISRMELGRVGFKARDVLDLLNLYGVTEPDEHRRWLDLVRQANSPGWWQSYNDVLPGWFETYLRLEQAASVIRTYEVQFVPGLLQSEDYARSVISHGDSRDPAVIDRRVHVRIERQKMFGEPDSPTLWAVLDEAALRRRYGSRAVQRGQIEHLLALSELRTVSLQVLPFERGGHAAAGGPFSLLRFAEPELPDIVYLEQLTSSVYLDKRDEVEAYTMIMDRTSMNAETPIETRDFLTRLRHEI